MSTSVKWLSNLLQPLTQSSQPTEVQSPSISSNELKLWLDRDHHRVDLSLFTTNVPTFILSADHRFLDWNPSFEMIFGDLPEVFRGNHISEWYKYLQNFRRIEHRDHQLFGEGILPFCDRERVRFESGEFGRMIFLKLMTPIIDRKSGKTLGWTVVLNINSVHERRKFFDALDARISLEVDKIRYVAAYDSLMAKYRPFMRLRSRHLKALKNAQKVLEIGSGTGILTMDLLTQGKRVTAIEEDVEMLRHLRDKSLEFRDRLRLIRKSFAEAVDIPENRYDAITMFNSFHRFVSDPLPCIKSCHAALKEGGSLVIGVLRPDHDVEGLFMDIHAALEQSQDINTLKHQFNHVYNQESYFVSNGKTRAYTLEEVKALLKEAGFNAVIIVRDSEELYANDGFIIVARK